MDKELYKITKNIHLGLKSCADLILRSDANSVSCMLMYQPTQPDAIKKYKRTNNKTTK